MHCPSDYQPWTDGSKGGFRDIPWVILNDIILSIEKHNIIHKRISLAVSDFLQAVIWHTRPIRHIFDSAVHLIFQNISILYGLHSFQG